MAKILFGGGVANIRGSIGGTTFSRNTNGAIARNRTKPVNNNSFLQQTARALFGAVAAAWRGLTEAQRQSFFDQAPNYPQTDSLGQTVVLSGQQLFNKLNNSLRQAGEALISFCLPPVSVPAFTITSAIGDISDNSIDITLAANVPAGFKAVIFATPPQSAGKAYFGSEYRQVGFIAAAALTADVNAGYLAKFGVSADQLVAGQNVRVKVELLSITTGQRSSGTDIALTIQA
jgi:hypothetical protein